MRALIAEYLGTEGVPVAEPVPDDERWEKSLEKSRFGEARIVYVPGRTDYIRGIDSVVANYYSMSYATPPLFGDSRAEYVLDPARPPGRAFAARSFLDWPGDTEIDYAVKH